MFFSLIPNPIHLLTTRLATLKHSATVARVARVQAQEVGVISFSRFSQGDTGWGVLEVILLLIHQLQVGKQCIENFSIIPCVPISWVVSYTR